MTQINTDTDNNKLKTFTSIKRNLTLQDPRLNAKNKKRKTSTN